MYARPSTNVPVEGVFRRTSAIRDERGKRVTEPGSTAGLTKTRPVTPLLKRPGLDTADMANYRPVSNVTFMSKIVERALCSRQAASPVSVGQWAITASPVCLSPTSFDRNGHVTRRLRCPDRCRRTASLFVTGRSQQVMMCNGLLSTIQYLQFGVPQGSVLDPYSLLCTQPNSVM